MILIIGTGIDVQNANSINMICHCACHEYPGIYWTEPCSYCKHYTSKGHMIGTINEGWSPCEDTNCPKHFVKVAVKMGKSDTFPYKLNVLCPVCTRIVRIEGDEPVSVGIYR